MIESSKKKVFEICTIVLLLSSNFKLYSQNVQVADSLVGLLLKESFSDSIAFEIHRKIGFHHPNPVTALRHSMMALEIAKKTGHSLNRARAFEAVGLGYRLLGNTANGFQSAYNALSIYDSLAMPKRQAAVLIQIANNHVSDKNYSEAIQCFKKSEHFFIQLNDYFRQAVVKVNMGEAFRLANIPDSAESYFVAALKLNNATGNKQVIEAYARGNLGMVYRTQGKLSAAMDELNAAMTILSDLEDPVSTVIYQAEEGLVFIEKGNWNVGINKIRQAYLKAKRENIKEQIRDLSKVLADNYSNMRQFDQAYVYQQQYQIYQDSLVNAENIRKIEQTKSRYELDKKNAKLEQLGLENELTATNLRKKEAEFVFVLTGGVMLLVIVGVGYFAYKNKQTANRELSTKNQIIERQVLEKEMLHREIHHRVTNNLHLISSIMGLQSQNVSDGQVIDALASSKSRMDAMTLIHQSLYGEKKDTSIDLKAYLEKLVLNLESTYFGKIQAITFYSIPIQVAADDSIPIGLIVNEAVCNAVKYAGNDHIVINIRFEEEEGLYILTIKDNGQGFLESEMVEGFGTQLIRTLSKQLRAALEIKSSESGTIISISMTQLPIIESISST